MSACTAVAPGHPSRPCSAAPRLRLGAAIPELLAQDALVQAVARIEQHRARNLRSIVISTDCTARTSSCRRRRSPGASPLPAPRSHPRRVGQQRAAPAARRNGLIGVSASSAR